MDHWEAMLLSRATCTVSGNVCQTRCKGSPIEVATSGGHVNITSLDNDHMLQHKLYSLLLVFALPFWVCAVVHTVPSRHYERIKDAYARPCCICVFLFSHQTHK